MSIKMKDLLKENFSGTLMGGFISQSPFHNNASLSKIVKEKYGDVDGEKVDVEGLTTEISNYNALSETIFGKSNITQIAEKLSWIAKQAHSHTLQETEDWFDKITVNRNMKELIGLSNNFGKIASEAQSLQERMGALYEDMGNILSRYYDIKEDATDYALHGREGDEDEEDEEGDDVAETIEVNGHTYRLVGEEEEPAEMEDEEEDEAAEGDTDLDEEDDYDLDEVIKELEEELEEEGC